MDDRCEVTKTPCYYADENGECTYPKGIEGCEYAKKVKARQENKDKENK